MPNYRETQVTRSIYRRCARVIADNPLGSPKTVSYREEDVVIENGTTIQLPLKAPLTVPFDESRQIPLLDPETLLPTGQEVTQGFLYVALFSAYIQAAQERDAQEESQPA